MRILTGAIAALTLFGIGAAIGSAWAEAAVYTLTGMGTGVAGTSKCATYQITIDVTVDGKAVKGLFKQQGRPERADRTRAAPGTTGRTRPRSSRGSG